MKVDLRNRALELFLQNKLQSEISKIEDYPKGIKQLLTQYHQHFSQLIEKTRELFRVSPLEAVNKFYWEFFKSHYIVVERVEGNRIYVSDMGRAIGKKGANIKLLQTAIGRVKVLPCGKYEYIAKISFEANEQLPTDGSLEYKDEEIEKIFGRPEFCEVILGWIHGSTYVTPEKIKKLRDKFLVIRTLEEAFSGRKDIVLRVWKGISKGAKEVR